MVAVLPVVLLHRTMVQAVVEAHRLPEVRVQVLQVVLELLVLMVHLVSVAVATQQAMDMLVLEVVAGMAVQALTRMDPVTMTEEEAVALDTSILRQQHRVTQADVF